MLKAKRSSPFGNFNTAVFKSAKFWGIFVFLVILAALPVALYEVQQQQTSQQHAAGGCTPHYGTNWCEGNQHYTCDGGGIIVYINPVLNSCSSTTTSFQSAMGISAGGTNPGGYTIHWGWLSNFCTTTSPGCDQNNTTNKITPLSGSLSGSSSITAKSATTSPSGQFAGQACGAYQNDFGFYVTKNSNNQQVCGISLGNSLDVTNNNATWCTVKTCTVTQPTPTPTHIPTPTPTGRPTATPTLPVDTPTETPPPSATPTSSPSATPTFTITPTFTVTPTGTLTPTQSPTPTPTGAPTDTPVPGTSPTPTIIVVRPTLPPTGPSNTLVVIGLVGVAISVLGMALLIGI